MPFTTIVLFATVVSSCCPALSEATLCSTSHECAQRGNSIVYKEQTLKELVSIPFLDRLAIIVKRQEIRAMLNDEIFEERVPMCWFLASNPSEIEKLSSIGARFFDLNSLGHSYVFWMMLNRRKVASSWSTEDIALLAEMGVPFDGQNARGDTVLSMCLTFRPTFAAAVIDNLELSAFADKGECDPLLMTLPMDEKWGDVLKKLLIRGLDPFQKNGFAESFAARVKRYGPAKFKRILARFAVVQKR